MAKIRIRKCKKCGVYTEQIYKGKEAISRDDMFFFVLLTLVTGGLWLLFAFIFDDRPEFWECTKCGHIHKVNN